MTKVYLMVDLASAAECSFRVDQENRLDIFLNKTFAKIFELQTDAHGVYRLAYKSSNKPFVPFYFTEENKSKQLYTINPLNSLEACKAELSPRLIYGDPWEPVSCYKIILELDEQSHDVQKIYLYRLDRKELQEIDYSKMTFKNLETASIPFRDAIQPNENLNRIERYWSAKETKEKSKNILVSLKAKIDKINQNDYPDSFTQAGLLHKHLTELQDKYFAYELTKDDYLNGCKQVITNLLLTLENDLGWEVYLSNLFKSIANAVIKVITFWTVPEYLKLKRSEMAIDVELAFTELNTVINPTIS